MLKSINKKPKLSEELQNEGFDFLSENSYLIFIYLFILRFYIFIVGSQIVAHTLMETGNGPNKPNTINL